MVPPAAKATPPPTKIDGHGVLAVSFTSTRSTTLFLERLPALVLLALRWQLSHELWQRRFGNFDRVPGRERFTKTSSVSAAFA